MRSRLWMAYCFFYNAQILRSLDLPSLPQPAGNSSHPPAIRMTSAGRSEWEHTADPVWEAVRVQCAAERTSKGRAKSNRGLSLFLLRPPYLSHFPCRSPQPCAHNNVLVKIWCMHNDAPTNCSKWNMPAAYGTQAATVPHCSIPFTSWGWCWYTQPYCAAHRTARAFTCSTEYITTSNACQCSGTHYTLLLCVMLKQAPSAERALLQTHLAFTRT